MKYYIKSSNSAEYDIPNTIEKLFMDEGINAEFYNSTMGYANNGMFPMCTVLFEIEGDWKHDHAAADALVREKFGNKAWIISEEDVQESDSDWYTSIHKYGILV